MTLQTGRNTITRNVINDRLFAGGTKRLHEMGFSFEEMTSGNGLDSIRILQSATSAIQSMIYGKKHKSKEHITIRGVAYPARPVMFVVCGIMIRSTDDQPLVKKYALSLAEEFAVMVKDNWDDWGEPMVQETIKFRKRDGKYSVSIPKYLMHATSVGGPKWKLVNRNIDAGSVTGLSRDEIVRMLRSKIATEIEIMITELPHGGVPERYIAMIRDKMPKYGKVGSDGYPPCIIHAISEMERGENLSHPGRFLPASYLCKAEVPTDEICSLFVSAPDYNESVTRSQVEQIKTNNYTPASCERLKTQGLCHRTARCGSIKNPIQYK